MPAVRIFGRLTERGARENDMIYVPPCSRFITQAIDSAFSAAHPDETVAVNDEIHCHGAF